VSRQARVSVDLGYAYLEISCFPLTRGVQTHLYLKYEWYCLLRQLRCDYIVQVARYDLTCGGYNLWCIGISFLIMTTLGWEGD